MHVFRAHLLCLLLAVAVVPFALAEVPNYTNQPSDAYMTEWLVLGPFPCVSTDFDKDFLAGAGGESGVRPEAGQAVTFEGTTATWTAYASPDEVINFDAAFGQHDRVAAYAYCTVECAATESTVLCVGSNDSVRIWVNGEEVWNHQLGRKVKTDEDRVPLILKPGNNTVLVKVEDQGGDWGLVCRFLPFDADLLDESLRLFRVSARGAEQPLLEYTGQPALVNSVLRSVELSAATPDASNQSVWSAPWDKSPQMAIGVDASRYGAFVLTANQQFEGDKSITSTYPFTSGERIEHTLFDTASSPYVIFLDEGASDSERWAASELQGAIKTISGVVLPIQTRKFDGLYFGSRWRAEPGNEIVIGFNERVRDLIGETVPAPADTDESFVYRNAGPAIVIYGGKLRGTMYGVMSFLERELGVRWYTPTVTVTPRKTRNVFTRLDHAEKPGVRVRNDFYFEAFNPVWAAHNRINGAMGAREQVGGLENYWGVHTFFPLMPPDELFATHPEYYSLIEGKRQYERAQLCLTNADVLKIMIERISKVIRENPEYLIYDVSQNDWHGACQCDNCQAIAKSEGSEAGVVIWFVNQVAEAVAKEFPDKFIGTLAYQYTRKPPTTIKPRENVVVRFCSIECCFAHPFKECAQNASFVEDMEGWKAKAQHIYIWDYVVNFSHYTLPYPNFRVLQPNIQFFRDHNAIGIMEQAAYQSRGGEFAELRAYVIAKLLWNPECDVEYWINDFMYGYYGRAGQYVRQYFDLLHNRLTPDTHIHLGLTPTNVLFSDEFVREAEAIFDRAEVVADSDEVRMRVEMARMPIMYLKCKRTPTLAKQDGTYDRFRAVMARENIALLAEAGAPHVEAFYQEMEQAK